MADSNIRGPISSMGATELDQGSPATPQQLDGPSMFYQDSAVPDIRFVFAKDGTASGRQPAFLAGMNVWSCDNIPQTISSSVLVTSSVATAATALPLATTGISGALASACSIAVGVPIIPVGTTVVTSVIALDFGFMTGTTTANNSAVVVVDSRYVKQGQWIIIANVGNSAASKSLITQVQSASNLTTMLVSPSPLASLNNVGIGQANLWGSNLLPPAASFGPAAPTANAHAFAGMMEAGFARVLNPRETLARNIQMFSATSQSITALVSGWDVWGNPMTEILTLTSQTTVAGKKAFKYVGSVIPASTSANQLAIGIGDTFGFPFRQDEWDQQDTSWNVSWATNGNGFTAAVTTPATATTGDIRGTIQLSTSVVTGVLGTSVSATATNGTSRLTLTQNIGVWNQIFGTPVNTVPQFGVAQYTGTT